MILGSVGAYKLVTTEPVSGERQTVTSFEQYFKTYDTIKRKIFNAGAANLDDPFTVPDTPFDSYNTAHGTSYTYRTYLTDVMGWHCYDEWAYAKRWNGYNADNQTSKGFEDIEHWFQTVDMGDGTFDFEEMEITPVLVLLDNHGWEIMRKPLPTSTDDPDKEAKYAAIRPYNSPMVEKYYFWSMATKETGYHKYSLRLQNEKYRDPITDGGVQYTSSDLTQLPPITAKGVKDSFGDIQDQYVTYTVKDEYANNLNADFLLLQGGQAAKTTDGTTISSDTPAGGVSAWISAGGIADEYLWTLTRNASIDVEMAHTDGAIEYLPSATDWRNNGFDPYNIQVKSSKYDTKLLTTNATTAALVDDSWTGNSSTVTLGGSNQWVYYNGALNDVGSGIFTTTKPSTEPTDNLKDAKEWHWKFLRSPYIDDPTAYLAPDPYAVTLSNRQVNQGANKNTPVQVGTATRYALLSHSDGDGYALALAGSGVTTDYQFLNGNGLTAHDAGTPHAATIETEAGFSSSAGAISADAKVTVADDINHTYTYHIITNGGKLAASADASSHNETPNVPDDIQSTLLKPEDYHFYGLATESSGTYTIDENTRIESLYGIYIDDVYVRYTYNPDTSPYRVPNVKGTSGGHVAKGTGSNDSPLDITGELGYNVIWYDDNMMYNSGGTVSDGGSLTLTGDEYHVWQFDGSDGSSGYDPYALKIRNKGANKYLDGTATLADTPETTFMLLKKTGYNYGILQATGTDNRLTGFGSTTTTGDPTQYIIFALATYKLYYNLLVGNVGATVKTIQSRTEASGAQTPLTITGTSKRTTSIAAYDAGTVSLGDALVTPYSLSRPFCTYTYYIDKVEDTPGVTNTTLTSKYEGLLSTNLPDDADLIGKIVYVDITYDFDDYTQKDYVANPTFRFATDASTATEWFTAESRSAIPFLVNYKYSTAIVGASAGRDQHYTNDHLWAPVGDPYGFVMHNRYCTKNGGSWASIMTTTVAPANNGQMTISDNGSYAAWGIYEMIPSTTTDGYFRLHPVAGANGLFVYGTIEAGVPVGKLSNENSTDWIFRLGEEQVTPYFERAGYVGALTKAVAEAHKDDGLMAKQALVYGDTPANFVSYASGYYRLHSIPSASVTPVRYASGYTHEIEKTAGEGDTPIPLHFYERWGTTSTFYELNTGFTQTNATRGEIPIPAAEYDPASIFYFDGSSSSTRLKTQDLEVYQNKMTATLNGGTQFAVEDIGGAVVTLRNGTLAAGNYLSYNQSSNIYDLKYATGELADHTKWCLQPADTLWLTVNNGGDDHYYATFYAPFDVLMDDPNAKAYVCDSWDTEAIHPLAIGSFNTDTYADNDQFIPAATPVIIRTSSITGVVKMVLPTTSPSSPVSCVFTGEYLEQLLATEVNSSATNKVFTFGLSITGQTLNTTSGADNGKVTGTDVTKATTGVGFYVNANPNKETDPSKALWAKNNRYVYGNKLYYRPSGVLPAPHLASSLTLADYIPVLFGDGDDDEEPDDDPNGDGDDEASHNRTFPKGVYDLTGRRVATQQQVLDGTWRYLLPSGIYIVNGKKIRK